MNKYILLFIAVFTAQCVVYAQDHSQTVNIEELTLEQMRGMTQEDLLQLPFEDLIQLVKELKLSSIEELYNLILNPTQSTASKMEEDIFNAPLATTVITADELSKSGVRSIPEALKLAPGIIVREKTNGNYDVHIRGNDYISPGSDFENTVNSTTLVMIDNRPVYNNFLGATFWENLPISVNDVNKIEIIYGPSAALYGPNAVSGVIHFITKKNMQEGIHTDFDIQEGSQHSTITSASMVYGKSNWGIRLSGNYQKMDRFQDTYYIPQEQKYISGDEVGELNAMMDTTFIADEFMRDYAKAKEQGALNLGLSFSPSEKASLAYDASFQSSSVQTAYMDIGSVLSTRKSSSFSNSLNINIGKFEGHLSSVFGKLNAVQGLTGYEYDYREVNAKVGYLFKYKKLNIHPGFDVNYAHYSDEDYVDVNSNTGLLNGTAELGTVQGSVRLDYTAFGKLRLAGAWMQGYFYQPQRGYSAYQFSTSYKAGENTLLRMVASKSNSSPFVLNTYMNKSIQIPMPTGGEESTGTITLKKIGNEALDPQEMRMIEMGLRHKFMQNLQVDVSLFYNKTKNYAELVSEQKLTAGEEVTEPTQAAEQTVIIESMQNMDLKSQQIGFTASIKYVMNKKFNTAVFATIQNTSLHDYEVSNADQYEALTGENIDQQSLAENPSYLSFDHDYTPKWYGGALINYAPTPKWNFNVSFYGYSKQKSFYTKGNQFYNIEIDPKLSGNLKASYQLNDWIKLYVNARNISHSDSQEFLFTDKTGGTYLGGVHIKF